MIDTSDIREANEAWFKKAALVMPKYKVIHQPVTHPDDGPLYSVIDVQTSSVVSEHPSLEEAREALRMYDKVTDRKVYRRFLEN